MRTFNKNELAKYNGKNGTPAYIAYKGKVYDVSRSWNATCGLIEQFAIIGAPCVLTPKYFALRRQAKL